MFKQLALVFLGLLVLVMLLVFAGIAGDKYYTARATDRAEQLDRQEAFARGMTYEEFARMQELTGETSDYSQDGHVHTPACDHDTDELAGLGQDTHAHDEEHETETHGISESTAAQEGADGPVIARGQMILPAPSLAITEADIEAMSGKAAVFYTSVGSFVVELYAEEAPKSVKNFLYLVKNGFYNGLYFYRMSPDLFAEVGSPNGRRGGTAGYWYDMEITGAAQEAGSIALVPGLQEKKVSSEVVFFMKSTNLFDEQCSVFGRVVDRFNVLEKISDTEVDKNGYVQDRVYIGKVEIVDLETVKPAEDIWAEEDA